MPQLDSEREHIIETIPWALTAKTQQRVAWDPAWTAAAVPKIESFWQTVDERRIGIAEGKITPPQRRRAKTVAVEDDISGRHEEQQICVIKIG